MILVVRFTCKHWVGGWEFVEVTLSLRSYLDFDSFGIFLGGMDHIMSLVTRTYVWNVIFLGVKPLDGVFKVDGVGEIDWLLMVWGLITLLRFFVEFKERWIERRIRPLIYAIKHIDLRIGLILNSMLMFSSKVARYNLGTVFRWQIFLFDIHQPNPFEFLHHLFFYFFIMHMFFVRTLTFLPLNAAH